MKHLVWIRQAYSPWLPPLVFLVCLMVRGHILLTDPRLWAEEAILYYARMEHLSVLQGLGLVVNGNFQLGTNAIVEASLAVPLWCAPWITTYAALGVTLGGLWLAGRLLSTSLYPALVGSLGAILLAFIPAGFEVYLSATNVQWTCSVLALLLCISEEVPVGSLQAVGRYLALFLCGLTGLPSCILAPVFLASATLRPSRFRWAMVAVIGTALVIQVTIVLSHRGEVGARPFNLSPLTLVPLVLHTAFVEFLPVAFVDALSPLLTTTPRQIHIVFVGVMVLVTANWLAWDSLGRVPALLIGGAAVLATIINEVGALDSLEALTSGIGGGRYFFLAESCLVLLLTSAVASTVRNKAILARVMVGLILSNIALERFYGEWQGMFLDGPSFSEQVSACQGEVPCKVQIWPPWAHLEVTLGGS